MAADLFTIIETVAVTQFLTPTGKALGETVLERGKQIASKAVAHLAAVGRQPQAIAEKLLMPMALGAGLEADPTLVDLWAALLANAADPAQQVQVLPGFTEVLRQFTPMEGFFFQRILLANWGEHQKVWGSWATRPSASVLSVVAGSRGIAAEN